MNLICERDALHAALSRVVSRSRNSLKIPILQHIKLEASGNRLALAATDLDTRSESTCAAEISGVGATTVSGDRLARLIDSMPKGSQVSLIDDNTELQVMCGKSRYKLPTLPIEDFPEMDRPEGGAEFTLTADETKRLFGEPAHAIPVKDTRIYLFGGHLQQRDDKLVVTCTDGVRLARVEMKNEARLHRECIVPKAAITEIVKLANGAEMRFRYSQNLIEVANGSAVFTSKLVDATFPDADRVIPKPNPTFIIVDRIEFAEALKRLTGIEDENSTINFEWQPGRSSLEIKLTGEGEGSESIACECDLKAGSAAFKPNILSSMLDLLKGEVIQLHVGDGLGPLRIVDPNDEALTVIAMPCRPR